jgi:hypothetical protein
MADIEYSQHTAVRASLKGFYSDISMRQFRDPLLRVLLGSIAPTNSVTLVYLAGD